MGAGRILRHNQEGFVLRPYDSAGWVAAIRSLAEDVDRRRAMGVASSERAQLFGWDQVARRRRQQILDRLPESHDPARQTFDMVSE
jgi:glycosyltransferase involved in cell wall biosynthesis